MRYEILIFQSFIICFAFFSGNRVCTEIPFIGSFGVDCPYSDAVFPGVLKTIPTFHSLFFIFLFFDSDVEYGFRKHDNNGAEQ